MFIVKLFKDGKDIGVVTFSCFESETDASNLERIREEDGCDTYDKKLGESVDGILCLLPPRDNHDNSFFNTKKARFHRFKSTYLQHYRSTSVSKRSLVLYF